MAGLNRTRRRLCGGLLALAVTQDGFPVAPGAAMPPVPGCAKQDYAVLFIIGVAE